jgi:hypothetical protein
MDTAHKEMMAKEGMGANMNAWQEEMKAVWEARKATDLEANPEEIRVWGRAWKGP